MTRRSGQRSHALPEKVYPTDPMQSLRQGIDEALARVDLTGENDTHWLRRPTNLPARNGRPGDFDKLVEVATIAAKKPKVDREPLQQEPAILHLGSVALHS